MHRHLCFMGLSIALSIIGAGCTTETTDPPGATACTVGATSPCSCGSAAGSAVCSAAGSWSACQCTTPVIAPGSDAGGVANPPAVGNPDRPSMPGVDAGTGTPGGGTPGAGAGGSLPCEISGLLSSSCGTCHGSTPSFGAPMPLVTWDDLAKPAPVTTGRSVRDVALERMKSDARPMPPAPHPRVSADKISAFDTWLKQGAPKGTQTCGATGGGTDGGTAQMPLVPKPADCEQSFELKAHGGTGENDNTKFKISSTPALQGNQYHCFYFKPPYDAGSGLLWFDSILDNTARLHHWILYATDNATHASGTSAPCNAQEPGAYFVVGWAPGANNVAVPSDTSLQLPSGPNAGLILEVHYYNDSKTEQMDGSGVKFCTAKPGKRPNLAGISSVGSEGICVPANKRSHEVVGGCDPRDDKGDITILGVWPHMHKAARRQQVVIKRKGGTSEVIHDQPFDFNSQIFYPKNVVLKPGDTIEAHCFYDNDTNEKIKFGERTQDEMCYAFTMARPAGALTNQGAFGGAATSIAGVNRCADDLSILQSCNGVADRPVTVDHPP